jgi:DNA-binding protein H-NS
MAKAPVNVAELDFETLGDQDLRQVMARISETLHTRFTAKTQEYRELAREMGFTVTLTRMGKEEPRRSTRRGQDEDRRREVSAKYRNPDNPEETWAGRGRKPKWVEDHLARGASIDDLLINRSGTVAVEEISEEADNM